MHITIIYDNAAWKGDFQTDWGLSCLIEAFGRKILFDTGANGHILLDNMKKLGIDPKAVDEVFISHAHWDHMGGLSDFCKINPSSVYIPSSCPEPHGCGKIVKIKGPLEIHENVFSTGELGGIEQSLIIKKGHGVVVIAGCSHPGVREILEKASLHGKPMAIIGGLHGFKEFNLIEDLEWICPIHCTQFKAKIEALYPEKYVRGGAGRVIEMVPPA